jgi:ABC-type Fe3+-siderophore transport system permease subunit
MMNFIVQILIVALIYGVCEYLSKKVDPSKVFLCGYFTGIIAITVIQLFE